MIRVKHSINGVGFVPVNRDSFTLQAVFEDGLGTWRNDFTVENRVVLPQEAYIELMRHMNDTGVQQMPRYNILIDNQNNEFFVDLYNNIKVAGSMAEVSIKNFISKDNIKTNIDNLTFEYLKQSGKISDSDMVNIPFVIIPQDVGSKILNISMMVFVLTKEIIDRSITLTTRIGDLLAGTILNVGVPPSFPLGNIIRFAILIAMDIAILIILTIALRKLIKQAFEMLLPPVRTMKAMTIDRLLTIGLAEFGIKYQSTLKSEFSKATILPVPIDYKKKKFFELLVSDDERILNRGYPTSSDTVPTLGSLIDEISKMYNIRPSITNSTLTLNPKQGVPVAPTVQIDGNFNNQSSKENEFELDLSGIWNTKIISYQNDASDKMLFDNPRGLRVEYKTIANGVNIDELTLVKGFEEIRINFALGTIKETTRFEEFIMDLAKISDKILNTSFVAKINKRNGVLALSQEQFNVTKLLYQTNGKQRPDYVSKIGAGSLGRNYHAIDESKNRIFRNFGAMPTRLDNSQFNGILQNNVVTLESDIVEITSVGYQSEMSSGTVSYRVNDLVWGKHLKTITVYEE